MTKIVELIKNNFRKLIGISVTVFIFWSFHVWSFNSGFETGIQSKQVKLVSLMEKSNCKETLRQLGEYIQRYDASKKKLQAQQECKYKEEFMSKEALNDTFYTQYGNNAQMLHFWQSYKIKEIYKEIKDLKRVISKQ